MKKVLYPRGLVTFTCFIRNSFLCYTQAIVAINADQGCSAEGYYYKIIGEDMYKKTCDFLEVHFLPDEPVCKGIGIPWSDEVEAVFMSVLTQHLSIAMVSSTTNDIVGVRMIGIASSGPGVDPDDFGEEPVKKYFRFIRYKTGVADAFNEYEVEEVFDLFGLGVHREHRRNGFGLKLMKAALIMFKAINPGPSLVVVKGDASSIYSKKIYDQLDFQIIGGILMADYKENGVSVITNTGDHKNYTIYAKAI